MIRVHFKSYLKEFSAAGEAVIELAYREDMTFDDLFSIIALDKGQVGIILADGKVINNPQGKLEDNSVIELYPVFAGG